MNYYSFDGLKIAEKIAGVDSFVEYGRFLNTTKHKWENTIFEISKQITPDLKWGSGYFQVKDGNYNGQAYTPSIPNNGLSYASESYYFGEYALKNWYLYSVYNITPHLQFAAEYIKNYADYAKAYGNNDAYDVYLRYGDLNLNKRGQQKFQLLYYRAGANSLALGNEQANGSTGLANFDATATTKYYTDLDYGYWYAFSNNFNLEAHYVQLRDAGHTSPSNNYHYTRVALNISF